MDCLDDIVDVVNKSADMNIAQLVGHENGLSDVPVYDWNTFLTPLFSKLKKVKDFRHFHFNGSGEVSLQTDSKAEMQTQQILRQNPGPRDFPDPIILPGLPAKRQWYLFKEIREFVCEAKQDTVCPRPLVLWSNENQSRPVKMKTSVQHR